MSTNPAATSAPVNKTNASTSEDKQLEEKRLDFSNIEIPPKETLINEKGRNKTNVFCVRCPSKILNPRVSKHKSLEFSLPLMKQRRRTEIKEGSGEVEEQDAVKETCTDFWQVDDIYTFENVGFTNTISGLKYLACADCEMGPIGYYDPDSKLSYVAFTRVKYD
uniref:Guanine nucleotide exchange factor MSS4 n=1 Tax=Cacopsylla melanoneura TaxID=428564 RepID=A0A8D8YLB2_9HEMI